MKKQWIASAVILLSLGELLVAREEAGVQLQLEPERAILENQFLSIEISLADEMVRTQSVTNHRTGAETRLSGEEFVLVLDGGRKFKSSQFYLDKKEEAAAGAGGKRLVLHLSAEDLRIRLLLEMQPEECWLTRRLEIEGGSGKLEHVSLCEWQCDGSWGWSGPGKTVGTLGYPSGNGQPAYVDDLFLALDHPGAENFARGDRVFCRLPAYQKLGGKVLTRPMVLGAGEEGGAWRAFLGYIDSRRPAPARMIFLVNDWYWKDKSKPLKAVRELARVKLETGVPVDSFTLDDGWDFDWDLETGIWGRLNRKRFPGGWEALQEAGRPAGINISLWFGPIGGYGYRKKRIEFARKAGYEINGDKLCLAGTRYRKHVIESFSRWAARGMDYIKVDGFWPNCQETDHGHPVGPAGAIAQMDALMEVFGAWRKARPDLLIGYTSGSNPSPFWLEHADFVWRGGADDSHAGTGDPFDRHNTYLDICLQAHRLTDMPISAFVTFDIVMRRTAASSDEIFERGAWWLAARTSLHHDWYIQASDLTPERWKILARVARWAREHEKIFRASRMVGGDPRQGDIYGFSAFDGKRGILALRNPGAEPKTLERPLWNLLVLPRPARKWTFRFKGVHGNTGPLEGDHPGTATLHVELQPLEIAVFEVKAMKT